MKHLSIICVGLLLIAVSESSCVKNGSNQNVDYTKFVNPFIGTDFTGNTYPGAQVPFGMVQLSPDNGLPGWDRIAGYFYPDSTIAGFSHTHLSGTEQVPAIFMIFRLCLLHCLTAKPNHLWVSIQNSRMKTKRLMPDTIRFSLTTII